MTSSRRTLSLEVRLCEGDRPLMKSYLALSLLLLFSSCSPILLSFSSSFSPSCSPLSHPGKRPFGVSILYMGWDPHHGFQLYQSDPSGNYGGWKATCIGSNHQVNGRMFVLLKQVDYCWPSISFFFLLLPPLLSPSCHTGGSLHAETRV